LAAAKAVRCGYAEVDDTQFWIRFVLAVLATWRVTHLLANEDGPADLIVRFRSRLGQGLVGQLMDCFNCLSLWIAAPAAVFVARNPLEWLLIWLALSGAACLLQRFGREPAAQEPVGIEPISEPTEGDANHVLWSETPSSAQLRSATESGGPGEDWGLGNNERTGRR
jgi:hypothetical protein